VAREHPIPELRGVPDAEAQRLFKVCLWRVWRYRAFWLGGFVATAFLNAGFWACANVPPGLARDATECATHCLWLHTFFFGFVRALRRALRDQLANESANEALSESHQ
jgi:hypothetical protein